MYDVPRKRNVANRSTEEKEASVGGAWNAACERIGDVDFRRECFTGPAPNEGLLGIDVEANFRSFLQDEVVDALEVSASADHGDVVKEGDVLEEMGEKMSQMT